MKSLLFLCLAMGVMGQTNEFPLKIIGSTIELVPFDIITVSPLTNGCVVTNLAVERCAYTTRELVTNRTETIYGACERLCMYAHFHTFENNYKRIDTTIIERTILQIRWRNHTALTNDTVVTNWCETQTKREEWR